MFTSSVIQTEMVLQPVHGEGTTSVSWFFASPLATLPQRRLSASHFFTAGNIFPATHTGFQKYPHEFLPKYLQRVFTEASFAAHIHRDYVCAGQNFRKSFSFSIVFVYQLLLKSVNSKETIYEPQSQLTYTYSNIILVKSRKLAAKNCNLQNTRHPPQ